MANNQNPTLPINVEVSQASFEKSLKYISDGLNQAVKEGLNYKSPAVEEAFKPVIDQAKNAEAAIISLNTAIQSNERQLETLKNELANNGIGLADVERKTASYQQALNRQIVSHQQLQEMLDGEDTNYQKVNSSISQLTRSTDTLQKSMALADPVRIGQVARWQEADAVFKNLSFSIGLVGYGMENLGRRFLGFSQILFNFLETSAKATESLERMKNALIVEGKPAGEIDAIETRIRQIADLPAAKLDVVTKGFKDLKAAGLGAADTLDLLQALTKASATAGTGPQGLEKAIKVLRDALNANENPFRTIGDRTLEDSLGRPLVDAISQKFGGTGAPALNKAGAQEVVKVITDIGLKLDDVLPVTEDRINRINNSFTKIKEQLEIILGPSLDRGLDFIHKIEAIVISIVDKFQQLSGPQQNFISSILSAIPLITFGLGGVLSLLGVLTVSLAVIGRTVALITSGFVKLGITQAAITPEIVAITGATEALTVATLELAAARATANAADIGTGGLARGAGGVFLSAASTAKGNALAGLATATGGAAAIDASATAETAAVAGTGAVGLTALALPLAAVVALIASYSLNLGHARDLINDAFGGMIDSAGKLYDSFAKLQGQGFLIGIVDTIKALVVILGGTLGTAVTTLILVIKDAIDSITALLDLFNKPSGQGLSNFFVSLSRLTVGWIDNLSKGIAAAILDGIATATKNVPGLGEGSQTATNYAAKLRANIGNWGLGNDQTVGGVGNIQATIDNVGSLKEKTEAFNAQLLKSQELLAGMEISSQKLVTNLANMQLAIDRAKTQEDLDTKTREAKAALDAANRDNPEQAKSMIPGVAASLAAGSNFSIATEFKTAQDSIKQQTAVAYGSLLNGLRSPSTQALSGALTDNDALLYLNNAAKAIADYIAKGGTNLAKLTELADAYNKVNLPYFIDPTKLSVDGNKALDAIKQNSEAVNVATLAYGAILTKRAEDINKAKKANEDFTVSEDKKTQAILDKNNALKEALPYEKELAVLERTQQADQMKLGGINNPETFKAATDAMAARTVVMDNLKKKISDLKGEAKGSTEKIISSNKEIVDNITNLGKDAEATTKAWVTNVDKLNKLIDSGLTALTQYRQQLDAINGTRAGMGLSPLATGADAKSLGTSAGQSIDPIIAQAREYSNILKGLENEDVNRLEILIQNLKKGGIPGSSDVNSLRQLAIGTGNSLLDNQGLVLTQTDKVSGAKEAADSAKSPADVKATTEAYQNQLKYLVELQDKSVLYSAILKTINGILTGSATIMNASVKAQLQQNEADIVNLQLQEKKLSLQEQLLKSQESNRTSLANPNYNPADTAGTDKAIAISIDLQKQLLDVTYKLNVAQINAKIIALQSQEDQSKATQDQINKYNKLKDILKETYDVQNTGLDLSKSTQTINAFGTALKNLGTSIQDKTLYDLTAALHALATGMDVNGNKIAKGAVQLQSVGKLLSGAVQTAFVGFFDGIGTAFANWLAGTDSFLGGLSKFVGSLLFQLGEMILNMSQAAVATAALAAYTAAAAIPGVGIFAAAGAAAAAAVSAEITNAPFTAIGAGLMVLGSAMGGNGTAASATASTNTSNSTNAATGATGSTFDPNTDPKTMYEKAQLTQIILDIRTDDGVIVKKVIKAVNSNSRLTTLIGNKSLGFG